MAFSIIHKSLYDLSFASYKTDRLKSNGRCTNIKVIMIRSRAYNISITGYNAHEITTLRVWLNSSPKWLLRFANGKSDVYAYVRFDKLISLDKIQKMFPKAVVETTTAKYAAMTTEYAKFGHFDTKYKYSSVLECEKDWQKSIVATLAIKADRGVIRWIDDPVFSVHVSHLLKKLSTLENVIIIDGLAPEIRTRVRQELITKQRIIDTVVLNIPPMKRIDRCYYQIINQLRDGYIADVASDGKRCSYSVINVLVVASSAIDKDTDLWEQMNIVKVQIR